MKGFFFLAFALMLTASAFAQREAGTLSIKPRAGVNIAYYGESQNSFSMYATSTSPRIGVAAGIELEYQVHKKVGLSAGAIYSQQGEKAKISNG